MSKRKILILAMSLCMVAILAVGGSLAYFTDYDRATNTFTVGDVNIHIDEWMDNEEGERVAYEDHELWPVAQAKAPFNKLVETVNDGSEDCYIRTFVTCPKDMYDYLGLGFNKQDKVLTNDDGKNMYSLTSWADTGITITINGEETSVFVCEYNGIVEPGESVMSLTKVWLYDTVTNELVDQFNLQDSAFKVEVYSQAIQAKYLTYDEAMKELGEINVDNLQKWFGLGDPDAAPAA